MKLEKLEADPGEDLFFRDHLDFRTKMALAHHDICTNNLNFTNNFFLPVKYCMS